MDHYGIVLNFEVNTMMRILQVYAVIFQQQKVVRKVRKQHTKVIEFPQVSWFRIMCSFLLFPMQLSRHPINFPHSVLGYPSTLNFVYLVAANIFQYKANLVGSSALHKYFNPNSAPPVNAKVTELLPLDLSAAFGNVPASISLALDGAYFSSIGFHIGI